VTAPERGRAARPGPLSGLPFSVKDNIEVVGAPLIAGDPQRHARGATAEADALAVGRVLAAGAIFRGKTNCPGFGGGIETDNEVFGRTNSPYSLSHSVGGSSGGEAGARVEAAAPPPGAHRLTEEVWSSYGAGMISYDLLGRWDAFNEAMRRFGERFDLILSPVFFTAAPRHGEVENLTSYTTPHNLTGWPAATVRCGAWGDGLPIGLQVVAHPWRDEVALAAALALERALGGYRPPSPDALAATPPASRRSAGAREVPRQAEWRLQADVGWRQR
jgi:Asp-tRNA(Asn)/Glu-tRNA(Gln) amidotransferase A subunit family amidase